MSLHRFNEAAAILLRKQPYLLRPLIQSIAASMRPQRSRCGNPTAASIEALRFVRFNEAAAITLRKRSAAKPASRLALASILREVELAA